MAVDFLSVTLRALSFIALFQAIGIASFRSQFGRHLDACAVPVARIGFAAALLALALLIAQYALEAGRMGGDFAAVADPSLQELVLHSPAALVLALRWVGLILVALSLRGRAKRWSAGFGIAGTALVIASFALMGHTVTHPQRGVLIVMLLAHLTIVALWFGALVPLYLASKQESPAVAGAVTERFSAFAVWVVPLLFIAGLGLTVFLAKSFTALLTTYGALLLAKVTGFAVLMGFAALNKWRLGPALASGDARIGARLRRSLALEYVLIAAVLSVTAVMTSLYSPE